MGSSPQNCKFCCFKNTKIVEGLQVPINNYNDNKYLSQPNFSSLIFLQNKIKKHLHQKNENLIKLKTINTLKSIESSNNNYNEPKIPKLDYKNNIFNINYLRKTTGKEYNFDSQKTKNKQQIINQEKLNFPKIIINKGPNIFQDDIFSNSINPKKYPIDNIRRSFPILIQGDFSYEGEWKNGKRDGLGIYIKKNTAKFIGHFILDHVNGFGKLIDNNGDEYIGYWKNSQANGIGIYTRKKIISYKGWWKNDRQDKFGMEQWPKLDFIGDYVNGVKEGYGIMNIKEGIYEGEMKNGNFNGIGKFTFNDKRKYIFFFVYKKLQIHLVNHF